MRALAVSKVLALSLLVSVAAAGTPDSPEAYSAKPAGNLLVPIQQSRLALLKGTLRELTAALHRGQQGTSFEHAAADRRLEAAEGLDQQLQTLEDMVSSRPGAGQPSQFLSQQVEFTRLQVARTALLFGALTGRKARFQGQSARQARLPPPGPAHTAAQVRLLLKTSRAASVDDLLAATAGLSRAHLPTADGKPQTSRRPGEHPPAGAPATTARTSTGNQPPGWGQNPDRRTRPRRGWLGLRWPWRSGAPTRPSTTSPQR